MSKDKHIVCFLEGNKRRWAIGAVGYGVDIRRGYDGSIFRIQNVV